MGHWQGTTVAVKKLLETDRRTVERLETEVRVLAKLRHPNLLLFMGYHIAPPIIVSEYMQRGSLQSYLRRRQEHNDNRCVYAPPGFAPGTARA